MSQKLDRRGFIKTTLNSTAAIALPCFIPAKVLAASTAPSEKINMGFIGVGGMGGGHLRSFLGYDDVHVAAVCDLFADRRRRAAERVNRKYGNADCKMYNDFREILARPDIDAVCIATPDHWHALIGIEAAKQQKDMYYEKPLAMSIAECKALRQAVHHHGVVFQEGTQQRSDAWFRHTVELAQNGYLGDFNTVMIGSAVLRPIENQPTRPVPEGLDYDMWLGPAPYAPYTPIRCTRNWTLISDYSLGCLGGAWGIHHVDIAQWAIDADDTGPLKSEGWGIFPTEGLYDTAMHWKVEHKYGNGKKIIHMDMETAEETMPQFDLFWMGILFLGTDGWIYTARGFFESEPKGLNRVKLGKNDKRLRPSNDHRRNFLDCVRSRDLPISPIDSAVRADTVTHIEHAAMVLGRRLYWDPVNEHYINDDTANQMMSRPMRSPWHL
jgi:predicted dehydrogenase